MSSRACSTDRLVGTVRKYTNWSTGRAHMRVRWLKKRVWRMGDGGGVRIWANSMGRTGRGLLCPAEPTLVRKAWSRRLKAPELVAKASRVAYLSAKRQKRRSAAQKQVRKAGTCKTQPVEGQELLSRS